jgi:putative phosphoribosyl transferase
MGTLRIVSRSESPFRDRAEAGRLLAEALHSLEGCGAVILGVPRGGVVTAMHLAHAIGAELDVVLSHKLSAPGQAELAVGAVTEGGHVVLHEELLERFGGLDDYLAQEKARQMEMLRRRAATYRAVRPKVPLAGRLVVVTDDGVATGSTLRAALWAVRQEKPARLIAALPVGPADTLQQLTSDADEVVCLRVPSHFAAVGQFYGRFDQVEDKELLAILAAEVRMEGKL